MAWKPSAAGAGADLQLGPEFQISEDTQEDQSGQGQQQGASGEPGAGQGGLQGGDAGSLSVKDMWTPDTGHQQGRD